MIDLYSSPSPNGRKISIMLEELGVEYNPIFINLEKKEQFAEDFSKISPSNKIPVIVDKNNNQTEIKSLNNSKNITKINKTKTPSNLSKMIEYTLCNLCL